MPAKDVETVVKSFDEELLKGEIYDHAKFKAWLRQSLHDYGEYLRDKVVPEDSEEAKDNYAIPRSEVIKRFDQELV